MAPFTPFICELMYQNLRQALPGTPQSVHWCDFPAALPAQVPPLLAPSLAPAHNPAAHTYQSGRFQSIAPVCA